MGFSIDIRIICEICGRLKQFSKGYTSQICVLFNAKDRKETFIYLKYFRSQSRYTQL